MNPLISGGSQTSGKNSNKPKVMSLHENVIEICPCCQGYPRNDVPSCTDENNGNAEEGS